MKFDKQYWVVKAEYTYTKCSFETKNKKGGGTEELNNLLQMQLHGTKESSAQGFPFSDDMTQATCNLCP